MNDNARARLLVRLAAIVAGTIAAPLGMPTSPLGHSVGLVHHLTVQILAPLVVLAAATALVVLCLTGRWNLREMPGPPGPEPPLTSARTRPHPAQADAELDM